MPTNNGSQKPGSYAVVASDGTVVNVIVCRPNDTLPGYTLVQSDVACIGYTYCNGAFTPPPTAAPASLSTTCGCIDAYKQALYDRIAHIRAVKEGMGVQYKGMMFNSDMASQVKCMAVTLLAIQDPNYWCMFQQMGGRYVRLAQDDVLQLSALVSAYVNACYLEEAQFQQRVDAAQTIQDLQAIEQVLPALP